MAVASPDRQASPVREARRETRGPLGSPCPVPQVAPAVLGLRVHLASLDPQAYPPEEETASGSRDAPVYREIEATRERLARKVRRETPVSTALAAAALFPDPPDLPVPPDSQELLVAQEPKVREDSQDQRDLLALLVPPVPKGPQVSQERREILAMPSQWTA